MRRLLKFSKKVRYPYIFDKRQRFAAQTVILTAGMLVTQLIWEDFRFLGVLILSILSYGLSVWSLFEDIKGIEWSQLFILPVLFTASVSLFYFLLPARWVTRLIITFIFAIGIYAILLVENIYNVSAVRSIQLLRAAQSVGLLITLAVVFLSSTIVYSLRLPFWLNMIALVLLSFALSLQSLWSIRLEEKIGTNLLLYSGIVASGIGELALVLSFWPVGNSSYSLFIAGSYYALTGIIQQYFLGRLFRSAIQEYLLVFLFTLILTFLTSKWG